MEDLEHHNGEKDSSFETKNWFNNDDTTMDKTLEQNETMDFKSNGAHTEGNNFTTDNTVDVSNNVGNIELEQKGEQQNSGLHSKTDTDIFNENEHEQSSDRLENLNVSNNRFRIVDSESEDEEIYSRPIKKRPVRNESGNETSDSEKENKSEKHSKSKRVINKFVDSDSNDSTDIVNSIDTEETASNKVVSQLKSRFQSLIDSESEDDQEGRQDEEPLSPIIHANRTKKHKDGGSKIEKKKVSAKASAEEALKRIKSETQRLTRELKISLPYHKPKQRTLQEFLSRKNVMSVLPKAPTIAAKLKMASAIVSEILEKKEKEAEVFYKSSDEEEEEKGDVVKTHEEEMNTAYIQDTRKDNVSRKLFTEGNSVATENNEENDITNAMDVTLTESADINRENISKEPVNSECISELIEDDTSPTLIRENNLITSKSAKETDSTSAMDITLVETDENEDNNKVDANDLATMENHSEHEAIPETADVIDNEEPEVIRTVKHSNALTSAEGYAEMMKRSLEMGTDKSDDYKGLPLPKFDDLLDIEQKKTLMEMKPKLRGDPCMIIDLSDDFKPSKKGIDSLIDRFVYKHSVNKNREINNTTIQAKDKNKLVAKETIPCRVIEEDPKLNKPGARLMRLKEELKHKMALKRDEEWKQREQEMKEQEIEWNESINEEDSFAEVHSPSTESYRSEEVEPIEDDVCITKEKKKKKSAFIDYEAEISEDEIENDTDEIEDEEENEEEKLGLDEDEDEDEDSTNEQNKTFKRIIVPSDEDSRSSMVENDKDEREDNSFLRTTSLDIFRCNSDENEANVSTPQASKEQTVQTPQARSNRFNLVSPATQLTALNGYLEGETPKRGKQINDEFDSITKLIDTQDDVLDEDLIGLCSGRFPECKLGLNLAKETNVSESQLLDICSGKFNSQPNNDADLIDNLTEAPQSTQISEVKSVKKSEEQPKEATPRFNFRVLSSDEEDVAEETERSKRKAKQLYLSDDEEENGSEASSEDEEKEEEAEVEIDDEKFIDYDSDENEIVVPKKNIKQYAATFLEEEAELSESDGGEVSADEDEQDLDKLDVEDGDDEDIDETQVKNQIGKLHMRQLLDEDKREVRMLQELLFEDGDLYSESKRERKFRWKNIDKPDDNNDPMPLEDKDGVLDLSDDDDGQWRKIRYEREKFLADKASLNPEINLNNETFKIGMKIVKKRRIDETQTEDTCVETFDSKADSGMPRTMAEIINASKFGDKSRVIQTIMQRQSFLARGTESLNRLAALAKQGSAPLPSLKRKNFVFAHVDLTAENS